MYTKRVQWNNCIDFLIRIHTQLHRIWTYKSNRINHLNEPKRDRITETHTHTFFLILKLNLKKPQHTENHLVGSFYTWKKTLYFCENHQTWLAREVERNLALSTSHTHLHTEYTFRHTHTRLRYTIAYIYWACNTRARLSLYKKQTKLCCCW